MHMRTNGDAPRPSAIAVHGLAEISKARHFVRRYASNHLDADRLSDLELVTSELVTNALEHGDDSCGHAHDDDDFEVEVTVGVHDNVLDVTVSAPASELPRLEPGIVPVSSRRGRGLFIVTALCDNVSVSASDCLVRVSCQFNLV